MSKRVTRCGIVAVASLLFLLAADLPTGPQAAKSPVVVLGYDVVANQVAVTLSNPSSSTQKGKVDVLVELSNGSTERVSVPFQLNGGSTATYLTTFSSDVSGASTCGIVEGADPM